MWGQLSDAWGRRPCLLAGYTIYVTGCFSCFLAPSIYVLFVARALQALGGSACIVLAQTLVHDSFRGKERGQVFSKVGAFLTIAAMISPPVGGLVDQSFGWRTIFLVLLTTGAFVLLLLINLLPETLPKKQRARPAALKLLKRMACNKKVIVCSLGIGLSNGLLFSYNAEGPFFFIDMLHISPSLYGLTLSFLAMAGASGSYVSKILHNRFHSTWILKRGMRIGFLGTLLFASDTLVLLWLGLGARFIIPVTLVAMALAFFGRGMTVSNCLAIATEDYTAVAGTATSLFVCSFYTLIATITGVMAFLHNDTLLPLPLYCLFLGAGLLLCSFFIPLPNKETH